MGRYRQALPEFRRGHELGSARPDWPYPSAQWLRETEELAAIEESLLSIVGGEQRASDGNEGILAAVLAYDRKRNAASADLYEQAFVLDAALASDMVNQHRYNAACAAALAGCGQGEDATDLSADDRARLRKQAVAWLHADLKFWEKRMQGSKRRAREAVNRLEHWLHDRDLEGVRDPEELAKLPEEEMKAWRALWAEVRALLEKA